MFYGYYREPSVAKNDFTNNAVRLQLNCTGLLGIKKKVFASSSRGDYYLYYLTEGRVNVSLPTSAELDAGSFIIFPPDTHYRYESIGNGMTVHRFAHFTGFGAKELLQKCGIEPLCVYKPRRPDVVAAKFESMSIPFQHRDELFNAETEVKLTELLITLSRQIKATGGRSLAAHARLERSTAYIHANFTEQITVEELAKMEHLSVSRYRDVFSGIFGKPPHEYITGLRLSAACELLSGTDMPIGSIAEAVGYPDARYFSRLFGKVYGIPPGIWRKNR